MKNKRELSFDILRVISMIMVIIIHVANVYCRNYGIINNSSYLISLIFNTISRISVPLFFMISGALLLNQKFDKEKYKKRLFKYIIIILFWDIFYLIWEYFYLNIKYDNLYMLIIQPFRAHLWFLYTIIVLYLLQPILKIILEKISKRNRIILLILWFVISSMGLINSYIATYFSIFTYIGYFILGKYLYDFSLITNLKKYNTCFITTMIICYALSIILNYVASINTNSFFNLFFAYKTPFIILSSILFVNLSLILSILLLIPIVSPTYIVLILMHHLQFAMHLYLFDF